MSPSTQSPPPRSERTDRVALRRQRRRAASTYGHAAVLQSEVGRRLLEHLDLVKLEPRLVVDASAVDGAALERMTARYSGAFGVAVEPAASAGAGTEVGWWRRALARIRPGERARAVGDVDRLPLRAASADLVWSNLAIHWFDADAAFAEAHRVLRDGGLYVFSAYGPDTLKELRAAFEGSRSGFPYFADMHDVGDALVRAGFSAPVIDMELVTLTYSKVSDLLRDLRHTGEGNAMRDRPRGLLGRAAFEAACRRYEAHRIGGALPATFEIVYAHAWKSAPPAPAMPDGRRVIALKAQAR